MVVTTQNEHQWTAIDRNTTLFFCLKQCIHMNQLYDLSVSMCSVAWLAPTHYINSVETYLKHREMKICFAKRRMSHLFSKLMFLQWTWLFLDSRHLATMLFYWNTCGIFLNLNHLYRSISFWYLHRFVLCVSAPHAFSEEFWRC